MVTEEIDIATRVARLECAVDELAAYLRIALSLSARHAPSVVAIRQELAQLREG